MTIALNKKNSVNILQLTDLHLSADPNKVIAGVNCYQTFENTLYQALNETTTCDLILITGDLVNEINPQIYDYIFDILKKTGIPFACIAGNHDVTDVCNPSVEFSQREFIAAAPDSRLVNQHSIETKFWQILLINSSVAGKIYGHVDRLEQAWLKKQLINNHKPALIVMHHHALPIGSAWMDKHILQNTDQFWATLTPFSHVKAVLSGHTHQQSHQTYNGIDVYTTPSTGYQYKPKQTDFAYDDSMQPGYRWIKLHNNGKISTKVIRLSNKF